jgi:hypothetical protein
VEHISGIYNKMADVAPRRHSLDPPTGRILDDVPTQQQDYNKSLFGTAQKAIDFGFVALTTNERIRFWKA